MTHWGPLRLYLSLFVAYMTVAPVLLTTVQQHFMPLLHKKCKKGSTHKKQLRFQYSGKKKHSLR